MTRLALAFVLLCFAWAGAPASAQQNFNAQQQAEIRAMVREYLVNNPDVLREALEALQTRTDAQRRHRAESDSRDFSIGPRDAATNPSSDFILLNLKQSSTRSFLVNIFDLTGKSVYETVISKETPVRIDLKNLEEGLYIITLIGEKELFRKKIIIEHLR